MNENVSDKFGAYMGMDVIGGRSSSKQLDEHDFEKMTVKGTCQTLEKEYLRLTAPPKARMVRPQPVLEKHLRNLQKMYRKGDRDYVWFCSQFKAMRQDLTVQRLNNAFTVLVYETHARIALEREDLNEYNQCQTQLKELYMGMESSSDASLKRKALENVVSVKFALKAILGYSYPCLLSLFVSFVLAIFRMSLSHTALFITFSSLAIRNTMEDHQIF